MLEETSKSKDSLESKIDAFEASPPSKSSLSKGGLANLHQEQIKASAWLMKALVIIFGSTIGGVFLFLIIDMVFPHAVIEEDLKDIINIVLTSETGIIGTALGFYLGNQSKS